jgi:membrane-bound lytic murein transglycosylase B
MSRISFLLLFLVILGFVRPAFAHEEDFPSWLDGVRYEAGQRGISQKTINQALSQVHYLPRVIELDRKQPEKRIQFNEYKNNVVTKGRIERGRELYHAHRHRLDQIGQTYGVSPKVIVALWGIETSYGKNTGGFSVISALATLAYDGRRSDFFRDELFKALIIIDKDHISFSEMKGSWAGAMGQNQFMPSSFLKFAVDGNDDGKIDIWDSLSDVFASTANYLHQSGWREGERWGREVRLTQSIPHSLTGPNTQKSLAEWSHMGVTLPNGKKLPGENNKYASLIVPDGADGAAFLVYDNYRVLMKWNRSIYFATSVGMLADAIE